MTAHNNTAEHGQQAGWTSPHETAYAKHPKDVLGIRIY